MRTRESFGVRFFLKKEQEINGSCPIYLRITVNGSSASLKTTRVVEICNWEQNMQRVKPGSKGEIGIVEMMSGLRQKIYDTVNLLKHEKRILTANEIKLRLTKGAERYNLWRLFDYHAAQEGKLLSVGTMIAYGTTRRYLEKFIALRDLKDLPLTALNFKFITDFGIFLRTSSLRKYRSCGNNTSMKHLDRLKKLMGLAIRLEWIKKNPFEFHRRHLIKNDRECLNEQELELIKNAPLKSQKQQLARHLFIFSCYTGLAFSEIDRLKAVDVSADEEGYQWIEMNRKKLRSTSSRNFHVLILPPAREILSLYAGDARARRRGTVFPGMTNAAINNHIHNIARKVGISKNVSFHLARHTFATTVTLANGISMETVSHMLGHASIKTTEIYAKMSRKRVANEMKALRKK
ncbi:phage integrase SAM-like domain-containing protein [Pedobacter sp. GSP4]|uniref:phage integrase SAM-like domain-containing protein n=1 Tax=Pedobacter sp. GSP4 TaxID=3453716 RepID=UPI003EEFB216